MPRTAPAQLSFAGQSTDRHGLTEAFRATRLMPFWLDSTDAPAPTSITLTAIEQPADWQPTPATDTEAGIDTWTPPMGTLRIESRNAGGDAIITPPAATAVLKLPRVCFALLMLVGILRYGGEMRLEGVPVPAAKRCLAILVCVSTLWAAEAIPMYITSLLVPILVVATQALLPAQVKPGRFESMDPAATAKEICGQFFDPTVLLSMLQARGIEF